MAFRRITVDPTQMDGVPCIRSLRIPVATVVGMLADGMSHDAILDLYPDLEPEDLSEAHRYASEADREPEHADDGVDVTLVRWMLSLTPAERLSVLQAQARSLVRLRRAAVTET